MHKFFIDNKTNDKIVITGDDFNHITKVLRKKIDDEIMCSYNNYEYLCKITSILEDKINLDIISENISDVESDVKIYLYICLSKSDKIDFVVCKATELGVYEITPVISKRCISKAKDNKVERYNRIAYEAAKQSKRDYVPKVNGFMSFESALNNLNTDLSVLLYENEKSISFKETLSSKNFKSISLFIGPEGGFDISEVNLAMSKNIIISSIGKRILRCETAPLAAISSIMYHIGEF